MFTAIDIETTGFTSTDIVTVVGFGKNDPNSGIEYSAYTNGQLNESLDWAEGEDSVEIIECDSEIDLLSSLPIPYLETTGGVDESAVLVGYNAQTYSGGFDFPFMRTRCAMLGVEWPFTGMQYLDMQDVMKTQFNTTAVQPSGWNKRPLRDFGNAIGADVDSNMYKSELKDTIEEHGYTPEEVSEYAEMQDEDLPTTSLGSLEGIHDLVVGEEVNDPFDGDSEKAVSAWHDGNLADVVRHNLCDIQMTLDLLSVAETYVHDSDFQMVRL